MISRRFWLDFMTVLGSQWIVSSVPSFKIFGIFKISRIFRIGEMIKKSDLTTGRKAILNLFKLMVYLYLLLHVIGCFWFMVTHWNKDLLDMDGQSLQWYPPTSWSNYSDSDLFDDQTTFIK